MNPAIPKVGVNLSDLRADTKKGLSLAADLGFQSVELDAAQGELSPDELSSSGRRHVQRLTRGLGLSMASLTADLGGSRFMDPSLLDYNVDKTRRILELARELGVRAVTAPVGRFDPDDNKQSSLIREALKSVAEHAELVGTLFAVETDVNDPNSLKRLLLDLNCSSIQVCYDPGTLLMDGLDPLQPIEAFADSIALAHLRDAYMGYARRPGRETNLGQGQLNVEAFLAELDQAGYYGDLVIRRSHSDNALRDLEASRAHLLRILQPGLQR